ncbi:MAG: hypothetical protein Q4G36_04260 [Paracoccus sp. (in: a-proteobacteria)]|nr:hypothetical protein [Paracoccus sp. (in: a-proteobacteria)]
MNEYLSIPAAQLAPLGRPRSDHALLRHLLKTGHHDEAGLPRHPYYARSSGNVADASQEAEAVEQNQRISNTVARRRAALRGDELYGLGSAPIGFCLVA